MSEPLGDAYVEIGARMGAFDSAMSGAQTKFAKTVGVLEGSALGMASRIGPWLAGAFTFKKFADQSIEAEQAQMDLNIALKASGADVDAMSGRLSRYSAELASLTTLEDNQIKASMASGMQIGIQSDQIERATKAAIGLAARYNLDLNTAMLGIARVAAGGSARWLQYYGIVDETMTKSEKFAEVLKVGEAAFAVAELKAKTLGGQLKILGRDFVEAGGSIVSLGSDSVVTSQILEGMSQSFRNIKESMEGLRDTQFWRGFSTSIGGTIELMQAFGDDIANGNEDFRLTVDYYNRWLDYIEQGKKASDGLAGVEKNRLKMLDEEISKRGMSTSAIADAWKKQQEIADKSAAASRASSGSKPGGAASAPVASRGGYYTPIPAFDPNQTPIDPNAKAHVFFGGPYDASHGGANRDAVVDILREIQNNTFMGAQAPVVGR